MTKYPTEFNYWPSLSDLLLIVLLVFISIWYFDRVWLLMKIDSLNQRPELCPVCPVCPVCPNSCDSCCNPCPQKPQVISLDEEDEEFRFESGQAELSNSYKQNFRESIIPKIEAEMQQAKFNVIEIIGHTDGKINGGRHGEFSNLDHELLNFNPGSSEYKDIKKIKIGSNADLGLLRAISVAIFIRDEFSEISTEKPIYSQVEFRVYSAGPLISTKTSIIRNKVENEDEPSERRIELRFISKDIR